MATYIVFTRERILDQAEMDTYSQSVGETFKGHPIKILAAYGAQENLEGEGPDGVVIVEFPDKAAALAWYDGADYKRVREHRFKGAAYRATLVEGL
ncbi:hypothetical protein AA101099_1359 [Neoasaia chiangmaiensis NBRC 101099]|uniref:Uncharacterized protein n=1 Tax=Neoasaia chiangmaiensis TaxID=320497 RepID=A0A1U9KQN7_9PROT|nr:DUF1330 domain-containing protein [Neoasaia chiangmaiensis]AQS88049.1 hypothetical protein A0U93_08940 [Neoasaia chiangmaiensis]GBR38786.1 hypothetical protein AA101099_1359 [Neoasaia chiangmaiensis NBRC 101099]GEN15724.1 hypothetical protein NCH01_21550 [Neoasaia chiangmaiensis]